MTWVFRNDVESLEMIRGPQKWHELFINDMGSSEITCGIHINDMGSTEMTWVLQKKHGVFRNATGSSEMTSGLLKWCGFSVSFLNHLFIPDNLQKILKKKLSASHFISALMGQWSQIPSSHISGFEICNRLFYSRSALLGILTMLWVSYHILA